MATTKPRLTVTLEPSTYDAIARLAAAAGTSKAEVISDLMQQSEEPLRRVAAILEAAKNARTELAEGTKQVVGTVADKLGEAEQGVTDLMDFLAKQMGLPLAGGDECDTGDGTAQNPRPVTRGSGLNPPTSKPNPKNPKNPVTKREAKP